MVSCYASLLFYLYFIFAENGGHEMVYYCYLNKQAKYVEQTIVASQREMPKTITPLCYINVISLNTCQAGVNIYLVKSKACNLTRQS